MHRRGGQGLARCPADGRPPVCRASLRLAAQAYVLPLLRGFRVIFGDWIPHLARFLFSRPQSLCTSRLFPPPPLPPPPGPHTLSAQNLFGGHWDRRKSKFCPSRRAGKTETSTTETFGLARPTGWGCSRTPRGRSTRGTSGQTRAAGGVSAAILTGQSEKRWKRTRGEIYKGGGVRLLLFFCSHSKPRHPAYFLRTEDGYIFLPKYIYWGNHRYVSLRGPSRASNLDVFRFFPPVGAYLWLLSFSTPGEASETTTESYQQRYPQQHHHH